MSGSGSVSMGQAAITKSGIVSIFLPPRIIEMLFIFVGK